MSGKQPVGLLPGVRIHEHIDLSIPDDVVAKAIETLRRWGALDCAPALGLEVGDE